MNVGAKIGLCHDFSKAKAGFFHCQEVANVKKHIHEVLNLTFAKFCKNLILPPLVAKIEVKKPTGGEGEGGGTHSRARCAPFFSGKKLIKRTLRHLGMVKKPRCYLSLSPTRGSRIRENQEKKRKSKEPQHSPRAARGERA